jgi:hypothetical protein
MNTLKENSRHPDLTKIENTVGHSMESLISKMEGLSLNEIKESFINIIEDPETTIAQVKINRYKIDLSRIYTKIKMQQFVTNAYLRSANLGIK